MSLLPFRFVSTSLATPGDDFEVNHTCDVLAIGGAEGLPLLLLPGPVAGRHFDHTTGPGWGRRAAAGAHQAGARTGGPAVRQGSRPRPPRGDDGASRRRGGGCGHPLLTDPGSQGTRPSSRCCRSCGPRPRTPGDTRSPKPSSSGSTSWGERLQVRADHPRQGAGLGRGLRGRRRPRERRSVWSGREDLTPWNLPHRQSPGHAIRLSRSGLDFAIAGAALPRGSRSLVHTVIRLLRPTRSPAGQAL